MLKSPLFYLTVLLLRIHTLYPTWTSGGSWLSWVLKHYWLEQEWYGVVRLLVTPQSSQNCEKQCWFELCSLVSVYWLKNSKIHVTENSTLQRIRKNLCGAVAGCYHISWSWKMIWKYQDGGIASLGSCKSIYNTCQGLLANRCCLCTPLPIAPCCATGILCMCRLVFLWRNSFPVGTNPAGPFWECGCPCMAHLVCVPDHHSSQVLRADYCPEFSVFIEYPYRKGRVVKLHVGNKRYEALKFPASLF